MHTTDPSVRRPRSLTAEEAVSRLRALGTPANVEGQARFAINVSNSLGVSLGAIRGVAKQIGKNHELAGRLWATGIREAQILASLVDDPGLVDDAQMEDWAKDFASWDVVDACCCNLFDRTPQAYRKASEWSGREEEFVKRAAFSLMACLAVHDKKAPDERFEFLLAVLRECCDDRNFVRKAISWALRQIGKRNAALNRMAVQAALEMRRIDCRGARWVASDALRELESGAVQERLGRG
ncbi:MAG: DNA alkylation repair protein [Actinomycetota bacterium]|nr:DNA alkylation repair protein [Actinomycetota bacterium]